ncbi:MAG: peptide chain release factor N(5)-glutamine methyltransferase [Clostridia bacterium]|nr:peptide chain release factor N(5)-glutamine methyltransferase [Clostridia bacterium]
MSTWRELRKYGESVLQNAGIEDSSFDAFQLLLFVSGYSLQDYYLKDNDEAGNSAEEQYNKLLCRRTAKEPLQYILGKWSFYKSEFFVGEGVLIPRPETEELVEKSIDLIRKENYKTVYDLCSGSGCIGLSIAKECPDVHCYLFELYDKAYEYLCKNAENMMLQNVTVVKHDVLTGCLHDLPEADLIVSNPPYIESSTIDFLQTEVLKEPHTALDGGEDGLVFYRAIADIWIEKLSSGGSVAVECGENQSRIIKSIFSSSLESQIFYDVYGVDRFVIGKKV